jgi:predicted dehydrogenase
MHLDKPGGESYERYAKFRTEAKARGIHVQMGYMFRANPAIQWLITAVRNGLLGDIYGIEADMDHGYGDDTYRRYLGTFHGGILYNLGCHHVDFFVSMLGEATSARPPVIRDAPGSAPGSRDNCVGILEWDAGAIGVIRSCDRNKVCFPARRLRVNGTNGSAELCPIERFDGQPLLVELKLVKPAGGLPAGRQTLNLGAQGKRGDVDRYIDQLRQFARIVRGEEKEPDDLCEHDLAVQRTLLRLVDLMV